MLKILVVEVSDRCLGGYPSYISSGHGGRYGPRLHARGPGPYRNWCLNRVGKPWRRSTEIDLREVIGRQLESTALGCCLKARMGK
jgi:hypothetical protein